MVLMCDGGGAVSVIGDGVGAEFDEWCVLLSGFDSEAVPKRGRKPTVKKRTARVKRSQRKKEEEEEGETEEGSEAGESEEEEDRASRPPEHKKRKHPRAAAEQAARSSSNSSSNSTSVSAPPAADTPLTQSQLMSMVLQQQQMLTKLMTGGRSYAFDRVCCSVVIAVFSRAHFGGCVTVCWWCDAAAVL